MRNHFLHYIFIFVNSFIKLTLLCKRPAVSIITTSASLDTAELKVSKATDGIRSICCNNRTHLPFSQINNCSIAAALKVSLPNTLFTCFLKLISYFSNGCGFPSIYSYNHNNIGFYQFWHQNQTHHPYYFQSIKPLHL